MCVGAHARGDIHVIRHLFGEYVMATRTKGHLGTASDRLGSFLLGICNTARSKVTVLPQTSTFHVRFGDNHQYPSKYRGNSNNHYYNSTNNKSSIDSI